MYQVETFYNNICKLSKSLVIKFDLVIKTMELSSNFPTHYITKDSINEWFTELDKVKQLRFYRHVAGELYNGIQYTSQYSTNADSEVYVKVIENETSLPLTKTLLEQYPLTKEELLKFGDYYKSLVEEYPDMMLYIHGCLYPVDIDTLLSDEKGGLKNVPDGTILSYNNTFVEEQESYLIPELETFIKQFRSRWFIKDYSASDNLYIQSFLAALFAQLPPKIFSIRCNKIGTNQANSFFLEAFFRSNLDLWDAVSCLSKETVWWLYKNLPGIVKNIGKNETLEKILNKVFNANNVGIGGYYITRGDSVLTDDQYTYNTKSFNSGSTIIKAEALNSNYNIKGNGQIAVKDLIETELNLTNAYNKDQNTYITNTTSEKLEIGTANRANSKVLEVSTLKEYTGFNVDKLRVIIDYWAYMLYMSYYGSFTNSEITTTKVEYTDPNTGAKFNINSKIGFYMLIKVMMHAVGAINSPIKKYIISTVLDPNAKTDKILNEYLYPDGLTVLLRKELVEDYPILNKSLSSMSEAKAHLESVLEYYKNIWITSSNAESIFVSANIRNFLYLTSLQEAISIHNDPSDLTIDEILSNEGVNNFNIYGDYDHTASVKELINLCLGIEINSSDRLENLLVAYKEIIRKLTSYTLHPIGSVNEGSDSYIYKSRNNFIKMKKGILKLDESKIEGDACNNDDHSVTFIPYIADEEIRNYDINYVPAQDFKDFEKPVGCLLINGNDIWNNDRHNNVGCVVELIPVPSIPSYETNFKRQYIDWFGKPDVVEVDTTSHSVAFEGEREQVKTYGGFDPQPETRFKSSSSKGVYETIKVKDNEREAITSLSDPLED